MANGELWLDIYRDNWKRWVNINWEKVYCVRVTDTFNSWRNDKRWRRWMMLMEDRVGDCVGVTRCMNESDNERIVNGRYMNKWITWYVSRKRYKERWQKSRWMMDVWMSRLLDVLMIERCLDGRWGCDGQWIMGGLINGQMWIWMYTNGGRDWL